MPTVLIAKVLFTVTVTMGFLEMDLIVQVRPTILTFFFLINYMIATLLVMLSQSFVRH